MSFACEKSALAAALARVLPAVDKGGVNPATTYVLLEGEDGTVWFTGTNYHLTIVTSMEVECEPFKCAVPAHQLEGLVRLFDSDIEVSIVKDRMVIKCDKATHRLPLLANLADFPSVPAITGAAVTMRGARLNRMLEAVGFAVDKEEGGKFPALMGVNVRTEGDKLSVVGCDIKQIAVARTAIGGLIEAVIPAHAAAVFSKFARESEEVDVISQENHVCIRSEQGHVISSKLTGKYPAWEKAVPTDPAHSVTVSVAALAKLIRRASLSSNARATERSPAKSVRFRFTSTELTIEAKNPEASLEATELLSIECDTIDSPVEIGVAGGQVLDALGVIGADSDTALLEFTDASRPLLVRPGKPLPFEYQFVTMPVTLKW